MLTLFLALSAIADDAAPAYDGVADAEEAVEKPETDLTAELGATFTSGNAFTFAFNGSVDGMHKWGQNRFKFGLGINVNLAKIDADGNGTLNDAERAADIAFTSERFTGGLRYDRFFGTSDSLYVSAGVERDRFAGLFWRFNEQLGYARQLVRTDTTHLELEVGVAYAQENFLPGTDDTGATINADVLDNQFIAARLYLGFGHAFNDFVEMGDEIEMFENFFSLADFRLYNTAYISVKLSDRFSLKLSHLLAFDNQPVEGFRTLDQTTQFTVVASIF